MLTNFPAIGRWMSCPPALLLIACGSSVIRRVPPSYPGDTAEWISMSSEQATIVDQYIAQEPADESARCSYWKQTLSQVLSTPQVFEYANKTTQALPTQQIAEYVDKKKNSVCENYSLKLAEGMRPPSNNQASASQGGAPANGATHQPAPTTAESQASPPGNQSPPVATQDDCLLCIEKPVVSDTGQYEAVVSLEQQGSKFSNIVLKLTKHGKPIRTKVALRTDPEQKGSPSRSLVTSTDSGGVARFSVASARIKLLPKTLTSDMHVAPFSIEVEGHDIIRASDALLPLYAKWFSESETGKCSTEHAQQLQAVAMRLKQFFASENYASEQYGSGIFLRVTGTQIVVATEEGTPVDASVAYGETHIFAIGFGATQLSVESGGYPVATRSAYYERQMHDPDAYGFNVGSKALDSRKFLANVGDSLVKVTGNGCALVVFVHQL